MNEKKNLWKEIDEKDQKWIYDKNNFNKNLPSRSSFKMIIYFISFFLILFLIIKLNILK